MQPKECELNTSITYSENQTTNLFKKHFEFSQIYFMPALPEYVVLNTWCYGSNLNKSISDMNSMQTSGRCDRVGLLPLAIAMSHSAHTALCNR